MMKRLRASGLLTGAVWLALGLFGGLVSPAVLAQDDATTDTQNLPVFDLRQCVKIGLGSSYLLAIAQEQREITAQDIKAAWGDFLPDVVLGRTAARDKRRDYDVEQTSEGFVPLIDSGGDTLFFPVSVPNDTYADQEINTRYDDWQAQTSLNVFRGFSKISALKSAKATNQAAQATELYNRELVAQYIATAYYDLLRYEALLDVANDTQDLAEKELERTETYFRLGSAAKADVLQARVRVEETKLDVVRAENAVEQAFADLAYAMNQPLAERFQIDPSPLETDFAVEPLQDLYAEALQKRLDLQSAEFEAEAARKDVTTATSPLWPSIDVFASYVTYDNENPFRFGSQHSDQLRYGYRISWSVFDRMQTWANRGKAKATARIAEYNLEQARLDVQLEIRQLYNLLIEARETADQARETITHAQEELRLAQERYRVGAGTSLDRINAQVNLATARGSEVQAVADFLVARIRLFRAVGRLNPLVEEIMKDNG